VASADAKENALKNSDSENKLFTPSTSASVSQTSSSEAEGSIKKSASSTASDISSSVMSKKNSVLNG